MFITAVCFIFLIKLRWPKTKSLYDSISFPGSFPWHVGGGTDINIQARHTLLPHQQGRSSENWSEGEGVRGTKKSCKVGWLKKKT